MLFDFDQDVSAPGRYGLQLPQGGLGWILETISSPKELSSTGTGRPGKKWLHIFRALRSLYLVRISPVTLSWHSAAAFLIMPITQLPLQIQSVISHPARRDHQGDLVIIC